MDSASITFLRGAKKLLKAGAAASAVFVFPYFMKKVPEVIIWWKTEEKPRGIIQEAPKEKTQDKLPSEIEKTQNKLPLEIEKTNDELANTKLEEAINTARIIRGSHSKVTISSNRLIVLNGWKDYQTFANQMVDDIRHDEEELVRLRIKYLDGLSKDGLVEFVRMGRQIDKGNTFDNIENILGTLGDELVKKRYNADDNKNHFSGYKKLVEDKVSSSLALNTLIDSEQAQQAFKRMVEYNIEYLKSKEFKGSIDSASGQFIPKAEIVEEKILRAVPVPNDEEKSITPKPNYQSQEKKVLRAVPVPDDEDKSMTPRPNYQSREKKVLRAVPVPDNEDKSYYRGGY